MIKYYWELGRDIEEMHVVERCGQGVIKNLSTDLQRKNANSSGLSRTNIYYAKKFYILYSQYIKIFPQDVGQLENNKEEGANKKFPQNVGQLTDGFVPQAVTQNEDMLFSVPWGHHRYIMDKYTNEPAKALTNVVRTMPDPISELAQEMTKDPYNFAFTGLTGIISFLI